MTTILRKNNILASDSKYVFEASSENTLVIFRGEKFFKLTSDTLIAVGGHISTQGIFDALLEEVHRVLTMIRDGTNLDDYTDESVASREKLVEPLGRLAIFTRDFSLMTNIGVEELDWRVYPANQPVMVGSGEYSFTGSDFLGEELDAVGMIQQIFRDDPLSGGDIYRFDLDELKPFQYLQEKEDAGN